MTTIISTEFGPALSVTLDGGVLTLQSLTTDSTYLHTLSMTVGSAAIVSTEGDFVSPTISVDDGVLTVDFTTKKIGRFDTLDRIQLWISENPTAVTAHLASLPNRLSQKVTTAIPEPALSLVFGVGVLFLLMRRRW